jgi:hypothetical protein
LRGTPFRIRKPLQVVAKIEPIHSFFYRYLEFDATIRTAAFLRYFSANNQGDMNTKQQLQNVAIGLLVLFTL